ncbi:MAG TPA: hypothetical protein VHG52_03715 [Thermomicrobiales bacterium]|nr:hypothetical protein [Thermomicrobiales bacterium]
MAQIDPKQTYHDWLMDRVVRFLQTRDRQIFPFTANFDEHQLAAFVRDLREGLSEVTHGGSARKTSATGFVTSDRNLLRIIQEWSEANGNWPDGSYPQDPATALGSSSPADSPPAQVYVKREIREPKPRGD